MLCLTDREREPPSPVWLSGPSDLASAESEEKVSKWGVGGSGRLRAASRREPPSPVWLSGPSDLAWAKSEGEGLQMGVGGTPGIHSPGGRGKRPLPL